MKNYDLRKEELNTVHQSLLNNRLELTSKLRDIFRAKAFTNRYVLHPRQINGLANEEVEEFFSFLATGDLDQVKKHGQKQLQAGLGEPTVLSLAGILREFCIVHSPDGDPDLLFAAMTAIDRYNSALLEGYMEARETGLLKDQEQLRRALSAALDRQRRELHIKDHAINSSINGIMLTDLLGHVNYVNSAFLEMLGYKSPDEVLGKRGGEFWKGERSQEMLSTLIEGVGGGWRGEITAQRKDGSTFEVEISASLIKDTKGLPIGTMVSFMDITERKQVEERIRRMNEELEQRVIERTAELRASLDELQNTQVKLVQSEKMSALGGLVAGVAHEINTPLGIAVTAASFVDEKINDLAGQFEAATLKRSDLEKYIKATHDSAKMILANLRRAAELVQSFQMVAVDQSSEKRRRFKLKKYIEDVLLSLRPKLKKTRHIITVNCPEDLELFTFPGALSQIITNLVMNSLIHGFENIQQGKIIFDVAEEENYIRFKYTDNGKGIALEHILKIFDPFFTTKRGEGGSGLGLHIVYNLVTQSLGGQIESSSAPGEGATFIIWIPKEGNTNAGQE
ncbi:MAG: PAS domain S-box protein [Deltaproteobacteria bacterium]|nr:PAS domain S-box protein [Deltaproteobacteria bacterium]